MEVQESTARKIIETPERGEGFDNRVHIRDAKTGALIRVQPYRLRIRDGVRYYERPVNSGNLFFEDGKPAGRFKDGEILPKESHIFYQEPKTPTDKAEALQEENETLKKELQALKAEKEAKQDLSKAKPGVKAKNEISQKD